MKTREYALEYTQGICLSWEDGRKHQKKNLVKGKKIKAGISWIGVAELI